MLLQQICIASEVEIIFGNEKMKQRTPDLYEANETTHPIQSEYFPRPGKDIQPDVIINGTS